MNETIQELLKKKLKKFRNLNNKTKQILKNSYKQKTSIGISICRYPTEEYRYRKFCVNEKTFQESKTSAGGYSRDWQKYKNGKWISLEEIYSLKEKSEEEKEVFIKKWLQ